MVFMNLKLTNQQILTFFNEMANVGNLDIEFKDSLMVHDLALNKKAMEVHFEALKLMNREVPEFIKYQREISSSRAKLINDAIAFKKDIERINVQYIEAIKQEEERRDKWNALLEQTVEVKNIKLLKRFDDKKELTVKGRGGKELKFILALEPFFEDESLITSEETPSLDTHKEKNSRKR